MQKKTSIGGQAVIEGIMMKGPKKTALAVRIPDGSIDIEYINEKHLKDKCAIFGWPIIRGVVGFVESMVTGYSALMKSADKSGFTDLEEEDKKKSKKKPEEAPETAEEVKAEEAPNAEEKPDEEKPKSRWDKLVAVIMVVAAVLGVGLGVVLFMYLPSLVFDLINKAASGALFGWKAAIEGLLKMIIFFLYILLVSRMKDIKRVFSYHGAEHKTIFCYEKGLELNVENVRKQSRFHPRCGTSFMILMLVVGVLLGAALTWFIPELQHPSMRIPWVSAKILMLPIICGIGYELLKWCGRHDNFLTKIIAAPGKWMQRITTNEPDDDMIEVAIESLKAVLPDNPDEDNW